MAKYAIGSDTSDTPTLPIKKVRRTAFVDLKGYTICMRPPLLEMDHADVR